MTFTWQLSAIDANGTPISPPAVPDAIAITESGNEFLGSVWASGHQIYWLANDLTWRYSGPQATLYIPNPDNVEGTVEVARHFGLSPVGTMVPNWLQTHNPDDNSQVEASKVAAADSDDPVNNIPWLKLKVESHSGGGPINSGNGVFGGTNFIQRVATKNGKSPSGPPTGIVGGSLLYVPYEATYCFWGTTI